MKNSHKKNLNNLPNSNPFGVPENYFESFPGRLSDKIKEKEKTGKRKKPKVFRIAINQLGLAASLAAFAIISYFSIRLILNNTNSEPDSFYSEVIEYGIDDYEMDLLFDTYEEENNILEQEDTYQDEIIDYLVSENIEMTLIYEEL